MLKVNIQPITKSNVTFKYVVIISRCRDKWVFVRHRHRHTWEIPGGHIEAGESTDDAASRELQEETGAFEFNLNPVADYSVEINAKVTYGRLYFAEIKAYRDSIDSEIAEMALFDNIPDNLTYPLIQPILFKAVIERLEPDSF